MHTSYVHASKELDVTLHMIANKHDICIEQYIFISM